MVLVDTSVWIDFFQKSSSPESHPLRQLIETEKDIAICGLIRQEILQGIRSDLMVRQIRPLLNQAYYLPLIEPESFDEASEIYRNLKKKGYTIRSPMDCLIAALAIHYKVIPPTSG